MFATAYLPEDGNALLVDRGRIDERFHGGCHSTNHLVPDLLLVLEFGDRGAETEHIDNAHPAVCLDKSGRSIVAVLIHQPVLTHCQTS